MWVMGQVVGKIWCEGIVMGFLVQNGWEIFSDCFSFWRY